MEIAFVKIHDKDFKSQALKQHLIVVMTYHVLNL